MVNNAFKTELLALLRASDRPLSGEFLGRRLGVSRVAVWKHLKGLKELGYPIRICAEGYGLVEGGDFLHAWEIDLPGYDIVYRDRVGSTMEEAKRPVPGEGKSDRVVIAGTQAGGRGRMDRVWESEEGGLYFTVGMRRRLPLGLLARYSLFAAAAGAEILRDLYDLPARAKWPNDILVGEAKLGGVLVDAEISGDVVERIFLGIGLNLNNLPEGDRAVSAAKLLGRKTSRKEVLGRFLRELAKTAKEPRLDEAPGRWKALSATLGREVSLETAWGERFRGKAVDLGPDGALLLADGKGGTRSFAYADCRHIKMKGKS